MPKTNASRSREEATEPDDGVGKRIKWVELERLHFDPDNPRFAHRGMAGKSETQILDEIVRTYGVEDVISSIAVNGYLETEPLVGVASKSGQVTVMEGNRRLAALLILADDPRARKHSKLREVHPLHQGVDIHRVPVVVYEKGAEPAQLLPYMGVRHIVGARAWDSYAKASWVADVLKEHKNVISIEQIEEMIGDERGTIRRLLEGYYVVEQLKQEELFNPEDSYRRGRGSAIEFPFSWVYNALGYSNVRKWIGMELETLDPKPIPAKKLENASELMVFMFGKKAAKREPAIRESRELGDLATCLGKPALVAQLRNREKVKDVLWQSKSGLDKVSQSIARADSSLTDASGAVGELSAEDAAGVQPEADKVRKRARTLYEAIIRQMTGDEEDAQ